MQKLGCNLFLKNIYKNHKFHLYVHYKTNFWILSSSILALEFCYFLMEMQSSSIMNMLISVHGRGSSRRNLAKCALRPSQRLKHTCKNFSKMILHLNFLVWAHVWMDYICVKFQKISIYKINSCMILLEIHSHQ